MASLTPGVVSGNMASYPQISYDRAAVMFWKANTPFLEMLCDWRNMPKRSGRTLQLFGDVPYGPDTSPISEAVPPPSNTLPSVIQDVYLDYYGSWTGISGVVYDTYLADAVALAQENLAYKGALTSNLIAVNAFEAVAASYPSARLDLAANQYLLTSTIRKVESNLLAANVPGREGGLYNAVISPYIFYDLVSDVSAGSMTDYQRRGASDFQVGDQTSGYTLTEFAGTRFIRTSTVAQYANYVGSSTGYSTIVGGHEAMFSSELLGRNVPRSPSFKTDVNIMDTPSPDNPLLQTKAIVSYSWYLGVASRPNTNGVQGFKRIRSTTSAV